MPSIFVILLLIIAGLALIALLLFLLSCRKNKKEIVNQFKKCNVIVDGKKGKGKDLLMAEVIRKRKEKHYSNIEYDHNTTLISLHDISVEPNTYKEFIDGIIKQIPKTLEEATDIYISDAGIYLPSSMDAYLHKQYPSFPIFYALSRHLYNSNVHVNSQNVGRIWKALREQADHFYTIQRHVKIGPFHFLKVISRDNLNSAMQGILPSKKSMLNKAQKVEYNRATTEHGEIKSMWICINHMRLHYDTRYFHKVLFGSPAPNKKKSRN